MRRCSRCGRRRQVAPDRADCNRCRDERYKRNQPLRRAYSKLKYRARERGHEFELTYEQYERFALESGYAEGRGKTAASFSIDRIKDELGYVPGNLRVLTLAENTRKDLERRRRARGQQTATKENHEHPDQDPF